MRISIFREHNEGERRLAVSPRTIGQLTSAGHTVCIEIGAGATSYLSDAVLTEAGATLLPRTDLFKDPSLVLTVRCPDEEMWRALPPGTVCVGSMELTKNVSSLREAERTKHTVFDLDLLPRITRAQEMDALSSMSNLAGYYAVMLGATHVPRIFPLLMTAAGTITPARVLVLGAGVAGLQAIATAKRLGAIVEAFDVRPAVKDQVESLGAIFLSSELTSASAESGGGYAGSLTEEQEKAEHALLAEHVASADVVITTALIPQKRAPILIPDDMLDGMKPGSVVVDLAASMGGNCSKTSPGATIVTDRGVTICAPLNIPSELVMNATQLYAHNIATFTLHLLKAFPDSTIPDDSLEDDILGPSCLLQHGTARNAALSDLLTGERA